MGLVLKRVEAYTYSTKGTPDLEFIKGQTRHDIPPEIEEYLLQLGYFHYVPSPDRQKPASIARTDRNYNLREKGMLTKDGKIISPEASTTKEKEKQKEVDLYLDDEGNEIIKEKGLSMLDNLDEESDEEVLKDFLTTKVKEAKIKATPKVKKGRGKRGK